MRNAELCRNCTEPEKSREAAVQHEAELAAINKVINDLMQQIEACDLREKFSGKRAILRSRLQKAKIDRAVLETRTFTLAQRTERITICPGQFAIEIADGPDDRRIEVCGADVPEDKITSLVTPAPKD